MGIIKNDEALEAFNQFVKHARKQMRDGDFRLDHFEETYRTIDTPIGRLKWARYVEKPTGDIYVTLKFVPTSKKSR